MKEPDDQTRIPQEAYVRLRSSNLELAEQLTREQRTGQRIRAMATLYHMAHELCGMDLPMLTLGKRFLRITIDLMSLDFGAFLAYDKVEKRFSAIHSLGFSSEDKPCFTPKSRFGEFHIVHHDTPSDPAVDELRKVAGRDCLLWAYNPKYEISLLLGSSEPAEQNHRIFSGEDQEVATSALRIFSEMRERKLMYEELKRVKERLELTLEGANLGIWDWNAKTNEVVFDARWMEMIGYEPGELPSRYETWENLVNPADLPGVLEDLRNHLDGKTPFYAVKHRLRAKDGTWKWILARGKVVERDEDGMPMRTAGTHLDITHQVKAEEEISKFKTISDRANYGTAIVDFKGDIIYLNKCFAEMHG
ncbi:MAG: PAS domain-containing protein, partial [Planctomycetota bacterium]